MELFEKKERTFLGPSSHNENEYHYYDRSARKDISIIRDTLNTWFRTYPDSEQVKMKGDIQQHFNNYFYELFLFQLFFKLGFDIKIHPTLPHTSKTPDFLLKKDSLEFYVEAKVVKAKSHQREAFDRKVNEFYDNLSKLDSKDFLLKLETLLFKTEKQPSTKNLIKKIEKKVNSLDPDIVTEEASRKGVAGLPVIEIDNQDIHVKIVFVPVVPSARNKKRRPIGMYPAQSFIGGGEESLREGISVKANRYGKLDKPLLICINTLDSRTRSTEDIESALWNSVDGAFVKSRRVELENVSGVLVTKVFAHNIPNANYWINKNPLARHELDLLQLNLKCHHAENSKFNTLSGNDLGSILGLESDWLNR